MGKVAGTAASTAELKRKKKGRPPKATSLPYTPPKSIDYAPTPSSDRRSARRNRSLDNLNEFSEDDEDERKEKKVKLVVRLPESNEDIDPKQQNSRRCSRDHASGSGSDSDPEYDDQEGSDKKRNNTVDRGSNHADFMQLILQEKKVSTVTETLHGSPMDSGPTTPLPDRTILVFILDRLQKKDIYGVFSQPVDPNELPDYGEIIEHPMDFGTVRKKLDGGAYRNLEKLEVGFDLVEPISTFYESSFDLQMNYTGWLRWLEFGSNDAKYSEICLEFWSDPKIKYNSFSCFESISVGPDGS